MSKLLVVFGATGHQGGSVIDFVLSDAELSQQYKIRAITRSTTSEGAQKLQKAGVEVVYADLNDASSLDSALKGVHSVFVATATNYEDLKGEFRQGKALTDAAVRAGGQFLIFSTLSSANDISGGELPCVLFDAKWEIEQYIRAQPIRSAFFAPGSFMENFQGAWKPRPAGDGSGEYTVVNIITPETALPHIAVVRDAGKWVGSLLADPERYEGKVLSASSDLLTMQEVVDTISAVTGKKVKYVQVSEEVMRQQLPPGKADAHISMEKFNQDYGYFGPDMKNLVEWSAKQARGKLTSFEEYLRQNPLRLA